MSESSIVPKQEGSVSLRSDLSSDGHADPYLNLELALSAARIGTWDWDAAARALRCNDRTRELMHLPLQGAIDLSTLKDKLINDDYRQILSAISESVHTGREFSVEARVQDRDGVNRWLTTSGRAIRDANGKLIRITGVLVDTTSKKEAEARIHESEFRLRQLFGLTPALIFIIKGAERIIEYANPNAQIFAGNHQLVGQKMSESLAGFSTELLEAINHVFATGEFTRLLELPIRLDPNDRDLDRYFNIVFMPTSKGPNGVDGVITFGYEVSEQVRARHVIERQQKWLEQVFDRLPTPLIFVDPESGEVVQVNRAALQLIPDFPLATDIPSSGYRYSARTGTEFSVKDWPRFRVARGEKIENEQIILNTPKGSYQLLMNGVRIDRLEGITGLPRLGVIAFTDIGRLKDTENELILAKQKAEQASRAKSEFLANMSHEIRTPLGAILGFTEFMRDSHLPPAEREKYAEIIDRNGRQLSSLISDILDLSKIEAGRLEIEKVNVSLPSLVAEATSLMRSMAENRGIRLRVEPWKQLPPRVVSDPTRLRQIMINVIGNAIKFTERGEVTVSVTAECDPKPVVRIRVQDTGVGITVEQQARLFKSFVQADSSVTRKYGGTGLGLVLSKHLAALLDGDLQLIRSEPGVGSVFEFSFTPVIPSDEISVESSHEPSATESAPYEKRPLDGIHILVAEDSPDNQLLVRRILGANGAVVTMANNGQEAVDYALEEGSNFHIVLMDIQMPVLDGYEAVRMLRSRGYRVPIIALTAHALSEERERSLCTGCNEHLTKPLDRKKLIETIQKFALVEQH